MKRKLMKHLKVGKKRNNCRKNQSSPWKNRQKNKRKSKVDIWVQFVKFQCANA